MWLSDEAVDRLTPTAPAALSSGLSVLGVSLQDWVYILTVVYLLVMIARTGIDIWRKLWKKKT